MRKLLSLTVMALLVLVSDVDAGKYGSGRGSSFGGGSSGRSSSFGGGSSGRSSSSGTRQSTSQPKYSSGSKTTPSSTPKYSSGTKSDTKPSTPTSQPKYSSGNNTKTDPKPSGSKYSSGNNDSNAPKGRSYSTPPPATGPPKANNKLDQGGQLAQQKLDSQNSFKPQTPKTEWKDPKTGKTRDFNTSEKKQVDTVRKTVTHERYVTYETRYHDFYSPAYFSRPVVYYSDPFGPFFYLWLLDRSLDDRAYWAYHHRYDMDDARYRDMLAKDAALEARIRQLEQQKLQRDSSYVPGGLKDNPDLMYNKDYIDAAYNPTPAVYHPAPTRTHEPGETVSAGTVFFWLFIVVLIGAAVIGLVWFIFVRETPD